MLTSYLPLLVLLIVAVGLVGVFTILASLLGPSRPTPEKDIPYESGLDPASSPKIHFNMQFYRIALLFLVFDIEAAFFYPWAVLYRDLSCKGQVIGGACHGGATAFGILVMAVFLTILILALTYVWRKRALEWD
ncbi:MAG: NADH-quinone oxidoreductase subunit A [Deltaproteobacteria bacterium]|nr:NADH-quinone oxidoreductase subunit A [Deltaproteobacteria bacterium]